MRKAKEILRLSWQHQLSNERTRVACRVAKSTVWETLNRARRKGLTCWEDVEGLTEDALEEFLYPACEQSRETPLPDWQVVHLRLRTEKLQTRMSLWEEYRVEMGGDGLGFSQFCALYRAWSRGLSVVMRQEHRAGEKLFVDFAGDTVRYWDQAAEDYRDAHLFVAVLGASGYTFARATPNETRSAWLECHMAAFEFFGGVPQLVVPDNPRALVNKSCLYDPDVNPAYTDLARHYATAILPARPKKPRDKAKVEAGVLLAERWILGKLRRMRFFSMAEINEAVGRLLQALNSKKFQKLDGSRKSLFDEMERGQLLPLPESRFEVADWKQARVNIDYHVEFDGHYYSVPFKHAREKVDIRFTANDIEVYLKGARIAVHKRNGNRGRHTTVLDHMPISHREYAEWTPERLLSWAEKVGPETKAFIESLMKSRDHPAQGFRPALGILRLADSYGKDELEKACQKGNKVGSYRYSFIKSYLKNTHQNTSSNRVKIQGNAQWHENVRGPDAFRSAEAAMHQAEFQSKARSNKEELC
jgi:transposase